MDNGTVDRRERERIMREGEVRDQNLLELAQELRLAEDLEGSPMLGRPLPWMVRLREIDRTVAEHERRLAEAWEELCAEAGSRPEELARRWLGLARNWRFDETNALIERHNRNYPAEARLPMDPRTGDFVLVNGKPYRREPLDASWILARFPLAAAERAA